MRARLHAAGLAEIDEKLQASERLTLEDGVRLFEAPDLLAVGYLANREREKRHGARTYFNYNLRLEPTNVCEATCLFCSFSRLQEGMPEAYTMSLEQAWDKLRQRADQPLTELHIVNGLNPDLPFSYYTELLRGFKRIRPSIHLKCFTAVEIAYFSQLYGMSDEQVLRELDAGRNPERLDMRDIVEHQPGHRVDTQRISAGRRRQLAHLIVVGMERQRNERLEPARVVLQRARAQHVIDALFPGLDVPVQHCHIRAHAEAVRKLVDLEVSIGPALVVANLPAHTLGEYFGAAARQRIEPRSL